MANTRKACSLLVALVVFMGLRSSTFVPAPARSAAPMAAAGVLAGAGAAPAAFADDIDRAAKKLSEAAYPFLKEIDWTDSVYGTVPTIKPLGMLTAIDKMIVMGKAMDSEALKQGALAHSQAIANIDAKGVTTLADFEAINSAIGHMVASAGEPKTMDVYNTFVRLNFGNSLVKDIGGYMMSKVNAADAKAAYEAFLEFKDVVKAAQR